MSPAATESWSKRKFARAALTLIVGVLFVALYLHTTSLQSPLNHNRSLHDQSAYMGFARKAHETRFAFTGNRNRMPLYPFFQALFYAPGMDDEDYFQQGKQRNVALSLVCLLALGSAFLRAFTRIYALYALLFIAFIIFAIKAPYFQAEIPFYTLFGFAFIAGLDAIQEPRKHKPIGVGVLFALAHLTKASAMPGLLIFAACYALPLLAKLIHRQLDRASLQQLLYAALTPVVVFMLILLPYFAESAARYRLPFYNVNTTFYMWFDSWDEAKAWSNEVKDRAGFPELPADEIPSLENYLREHSPEQVLDRITGGFANIVDSACACKWCRYKYGYCSQVALLLPLLALTLMASLWLGFRSKTAASADRPDKDLKLAHAFLFAAAFMLIYALSFAWYMPLIGKGPRTFFALAIPLLWSLGVAMGRREIQSLRIRLLGRDIRMFDLVWLVMLLTLAYEIYEVVTIDAAIMDGGN